MFDDNPYSPPVDVRPGRYDWSLGKRIFYAVLALAFVYLSASAVASYQTYRSMPSSHNKSVVQQLKSFASDWRPKKWGPTRGQ